MEDPEFMKEYFFYDNLDEMKKEELLRLYEIYKKTDSNIMDIYDKAMRLKKNNFFREAIEKFNQCIKLVKDNPILLNKILTNRSICHSMFKEYQYVYTDLHRAMEVFEYNFATIELLLIICERMVLCDEFIKCLSIMYKLTKKKKYIDLAIKMNLNKKRLAKIDKVCGETLPLYDITDESNFINDKIKFVNTRIKDHFLFFNKYNTDNIKFAEDEIFGRHLIANRNFNKGEIIFTEYPIMSTTLNPSDKLCEVCFSESIYYSSKLKEEFFCSEKCRQIAYKTYLKALEGKKINALKEKMAKEYVKDITYTDFLVIKIFFMMQQEEMEYPNNPEKHENSMKMRHIYTKNTEEITNINIFKRFLFIKDSLNLNDNESFSFQFFNETYYKVHNNLKVINLEEKELEDLTDDEMKGSLLHFYFSFLNHSCVPNAKIQKNSKTNLIKVTIEAEKNIQKGEQIFISYLPEYLLLKMKQSDDFVTTLGFECQCEKCIKEIKKKPKSKKKNHNMLTLDLFSQ